MVEFLILLTLMGIRMHWAGDELIGGIDPAGLFCPELYPELCKHISIGIER